MNVQRRCFLAMACNNFIDMMGGYKNVHEISDRLKDSTQKQTNGVSLKA